MTFRIQKTVEGRRLAFILSGRIRAEHVPELLALLKAEAPGNQIILDLEQVKLVDRCAVLFLALSEARGIELKNCAAFIREWIQRERSLRESGSENPTKLED